MPQFLRASCFALPLSREKAQHKRDIKIFYHYQEEFSINFHIFIHKNYALPISFSGCVFLQKAGKKAIISACQKSRRGILPKQEDSSAAFV
jgi:hypothetical protein